MARKTVVTSSDTALWAFIVDRSQQMGLTLQDLAEKANLATQSIRDVAAKDANPKWDTIRSLAQALEIPPEEIVCLLAEDTNCNTYRLKDSPSPYRVHSTLEDANRIWQAYLAIAQSVIDAQLPDNIRPKPTDIVELAKATLKVS